MNNPFLSYNLRKFPMLESDNSTGNDTVSINVVEPIYSVGIDGLLELKLMGSFSKILIKLMVMI